MSLDRRQLITGLAGAGMTTFASETAAAPRALIESLTEVQQNAGHIFLSRHSTVDVHSHPGRFFIRDVVNPSPRLKAYGPPFEKRVSEEMRAGRVSAALFSAVADMSILEFSPERGMFAFRPFAAGEAWADYRRQIATLKGMVESCMVERGESVRDVHDAHHRVRTAAIFAVEGGDFIEDQLDRIGIAYNDGVRSITLVHYHVNQIGDIQTAPAHHDRLTPIGRDIIREMNRIGIIVDLAHAPMSVVRGAADVSTRPMIMSHTNLSRRDFNHPRLVSPEKARLVTNAGGVVGSVPSGIGQSTFAEWIDSIVRMIDMLGVDHVAIGTDMDANFMPVFTSYLDWHMIPAALLARRLAEAEVEKVMGGNFLRVFAANAD